MTTTELINVTLESLLEFDIETQHEILNRLRQEVVENWQLNLEAGEEALGYFA